MKPISGLAISLTSITLIRKCWSMTTILKVQVEELGNYFMSTTKWLFSLLKELKTCIK